MKSAPKAQMKQPHVTKIKAHCTADAKVKVQYIQSNEVAEANPAAPPLEPFEAENVEYLDEAFSAPTTPDVDPFYPNAVHCLIALYRGKYQELLTKTIPEIKEINIWDPITKEMHESFFNFSREQLKTKFASLRQQYFSLNTATGVKGFEYFDQMHEIYRDKDVEMLIRATPGKKIILNSQQRGQEYLDAMLPQDAEEKPLQPLTSKSPRNEATAHKEHELMDMVEKELMAMESGAALNEVHSLMADGDGIQTKSPFKDAQPKTTNVKTLIINRGGSADGGETMKRRKVEPTSTRPPKVMAIPLKAKDSMTLQDFDAQQERRHKELMEMLQHMLKTQERVLDRQRFLMEEVVTRLC